MCYIQFYFEGKTSSNYCRTFFFGSECNNFKIFFTLILMLQVKIKSVSMCVKQHYFLLTIYKMASKAKILLIVSGWKVTVHIHVLIFLVISSKHHVCLFFQLEILMVFLTLLSIGSHPALNSVLTLVIIFQFVHTASFTIPHLPVRFLIILTSLQRSPYFPPPLFFGYA